MRSRFAYVRPGSLSEALGHLAEHGAETAVLAGGTDLSIEIRAGRLHRTYVMDISRLEELRAVERRDGATAIGAAVTFSEVMEHPILKEFAPVLVAAAGCVGSTQIRNMGTLGGNVGNASPAADGIPPLLVHAGKVVIQTAGSQRIEPVEEFITGPYRTTLKPGELITHLLIEPLGEGHRANFQRIARRKALAIARINAAAAARINSGGAIEDLRLAVGSITPQPCRMTAAEEHLKGKLPTSSLVREAAEQVSQEMIRQSGIRHSTEYKRPAVEGLVTKVLTVVLIESR
jgi:CO/xanthine dehydrogenase FAD-binding subunit